MSTFNPNIGPIISGNTSFKSELKPYSNKLKIAHINCQSMRPSNNSIKFDELKNVLIGNFDLIALSETWLKPYISCTSVNFPGYKLVRNDRLNNRGGGVCIYVSKKLKYKVVLKVSEGECETVFIEIWSEGINILFGVVYLPYGDLVTFENSHFALFSLYSNIIAVGDFNCNLFNNSFADRIRSMCTRCNLSIYHNSRPTHFDIAHLSTSLLDFWLVSDTNVVAFANQGQCPGISHHSLIYAAFHFDSSDIDEFFEYRDFNRINWDALLLCVSDFDFTLFYESNIEQQCSILQYFIQSLFEFVPIIRRRIKHENDRWMNSQSIVLARSLRDLAFSNFRLTKSPDHWRVFCKYRNKAKAVIRKEKRLYYTKLFAGLNTSDLWKVLKGRGLSNDNVICADLDVNNINNFFVDGLSSNNIVCPDFNIFEDCAGLFSFRCIGDDELFNALCKVKSKAVGVDGIQIRFLKIIFPYISNLLLHHVNSILTSSFFPSAWKLAKVVPIPKCKSVHTLDDLRPISILPTLSKVMEHILRDQIYSFVWRDIMPSQFAFRRGYNTTSLLLDLTDNIRSDINVGKVNALLSLDLSKAFNSINYLTLIDKLKTIFKFSKSACKLIFSYLTDRYQFVDLSGVLSDVLPLTSGVPQGSVLGPLLFILNMNDLTNYIDTNLCKPFLYADDIFLLFNSYHDSYDVLECKINYTLNCVLQWTIDNSFMINPSKTKALLFGSSNNNINITIGSTRISFVKNLKCLGVIIDDQLNFGCHIDYLCGRIIGVLRKFYSSNLYFPVAIKYKLAYAFLMPHVFYGLEIFSGTLLYNISRLNRIVNTIVRFAYNIRRFTHISGYVKMFLGCNFKNFISLRILLYFFQVIKTGVPAQLCSAFSFSHSTRNPQIVIPRLRTAIFERSFIVRVARRWNRLPLILRIFSHTNNAFRLKLLDHLVET